MWFYDNDRSLTLQRRSLCSPPIPTCLRISDADQAEKRVGAECNGSGFCESYPMIKYFVSTGHPDFRNGMAEYLRATPEIADEAANNAGKFRFRTKSYFLPH